MFKYGQKLSKVRMLVVDVKKIDFKEKKNRKYNYFYSMKLMNHKNKIAAVLWDASKGDDVIKEVNAKNWATVLVTGNVKSSNKKLQLEIDEIVIIDDDPTNYQIAIDDIEDSKISDLYQSYLNLFMKIKDKDIRNLVTSAYDGLETKAQKGITTKKQYIGGYLETIVKIGALSLTIAKMQLEFNNKKIHKDLLIAGIMLKYTGYLNKFSIVPIIKDNKLCLNAESYKILLNTLHVKKVNISENTLFKLKAIVNDEKEENFIEKDIISIAENSLL